MGSLKIHSLEEKSLTSFKRLFSPRSQVPLNTKLSYSRIYLEGHSKYPFFYVTFFIFVQTSPCYNQQLEKQSSNCSPLEGPEPSQ